MKIFSKIMFCLLVACGFAACSESDDAWDPYYDWQSRNALWFEQVADSARQAIAEAKTQYGDAWEDHCDWRMYKTLLKSQDADAKGVLADSICVKIVNRGKEDGLIASFNDTVRLCFRGWLMETKYDEGDGTLTDYRYVFTQTYYGDYNPETAAPSLSHVGSMIEGFQTALQYMPEGADWYVYIPQELAYGSKSEDNIPAYSTLLFRINMVAVYPAGSGVPTWYIRRR